MGIPVESDGAHVIDGYADETVLMDPTLFQGTTKEVSIYDLALLADIGYEIQGFTKQGSTPEIATDGSERIFGQDIADVINALDGDDTIQAAGGDDELRGGPGNDVMFGQDGVDTFVIGAGDEQNTIVDFDLNTETIRLIDSGFATAAAAAAAVTKIASNVSRFTFEDGTTVDVFHESQTGTPLTATHFEIAGGETPEDPPDPDPDPTPPTNSAPEGTVTISGTLQVGETLVADASGISDADGLGQLSYQWLRDGIEIGGANQGFYELTKLDVGKAMQVEVSYVDGLDKFEFVFSAETQLVQAAPADTGGDGGSAPESDSRSGGGGQDTGGQDSGGGRSRDQGVGQNQENSAPTGILVILGEAKIGETLTARPNGIVDSDGIDDTTVEFQWLRNGEDIPGATAATYDVTEDDAGSTISLRYTYTDLVGTTETVVSDPKPTVPASDTPDSGDGGTGGDDGSGGDQGDGDGGDTPPEEPEEPDSVNDTETNATPFNDIFTAHSGMAPVDGGDGVDTVVFFGNQNHYTVRIEAGLVVVTDRREDGVGSFELQNVERVAFEVEIPGYEGPVVLPQLNDADFSSDEEFEGFIEMYIAYFNRAPDAVGLAFWGAAYANGTSLEEMARLFVDQDETRDTYPEGTSNVIFITEVYDNVLGRMPDFEGLQFWRGVLDSGAVSRDEFILEILRGVDAAPDASLGQNFVDQQLADQAFLQMKTDIGALYAVHRGLTDVNDAAAIMAMVDGSSEGLQTAVAAVNNAYSDALDPENGEFLMPIVGLLDDPFTA